MQIVRAVSHNDGLEILTAVCKKTHPRNRSPNAVAFEHGSSSSYFRPRPPVPLGPYVGRLLQLLPRSFHPAVVRSCCLDPTDPQSCDLRVLHSVPELSTHDRYLSNEELAQLLAAAGPLAGGCVEQATAGTDSGRRLQPDQRAPGTPAGTGSCVHACDGPSETGCGAEWRLPEGGLTRLQLGIDESRDVLRPPAGGDDSLRIQQPARWCTALAQLRTLRSLAVAVAGGGLTYSVGEFTAALRHLPALTHLRISYADLGQSPQLEDTPAATANGVSQLLEGAAMLGSQLQCFELGRCSDVAPSADRARLESAAGAIAQMSRLSRLTCLRLTGMVFTSELVLAWAEAISELPALQELCIVPVRGGVSSALRESRAAGSAHSVLLRNLFDIPGFPSLSHLQMGVEEVQGRVDRISDEALLAECHGGMRKHNPALLSRLTGLCLGPGIFACDPTGGSVAALLADMPALRSLRLNASSDGFAMAQFRAGGLMSSGDLLSLVDVLPGMSRLTRLDISCCGARGVAVLAVLTALARRGVEECEGLRELDIGGNDVWPQHAAELAGVLRQFSGLERLGMHNLGLNGRFGLEGLGPVLLGLADLPRLQVLYAVHNVRQADKAAAWDLTAGLAHVSDVQL